MKPVVRAALLIAAASLLLGGDCMFGRPIVDDRGRYYPSDGVISCTGTACADLPAYDLELPPPLEDSPCEQDLPVADLDSVVGASTELVGRRYELESERERELHLGAVQLRDTCIVISGPARLNFGAGSKLTNVTLLLGPAPTEAVDAGSAQGPRATPNLHLAHAELDRVVLRGVEDAAPSGSAQVEYSVCNQCETRVDALTLTESQLQNSRIGASSLTVAGGVLDSLELGFDYGLLAGVLANNVRTVACNTLSLVGATIAGRASKIGPCDCSHVPPSEALGDSGATSEGGVHSDAGPGDAGVGGDAGELLDAESPGDVPAPRDASAAGDAADAADPVDTSDAGDAANASAAGDATTFDADLEGDQRDAAEPDAGTFEAGAVDADVVDADPAEAGDSAPPIMDAGERDASGDDAAVVCNGATISQTTFLGGMVDGKVHAENSTFRSVLFARHDVTALDLWNTTLELTVLCTHQVDVRLDESSGIGCTSCDSAEQVTACSLDGAPKLIVNPCAALRDEQPQCKPPLPVRRTPNVPMPQSLGQGGGLKRSPRPATGT